MKLENNVKLDKALHVWFTQKRMEGVPVSGPMLCEKAKLLHKQIQPEQPFVASEGWKWRFCRRHGVRNLSLEGENSLPINQLLMILLSLFPGLCRKRNHA